MKNYWLWGALSMVGGLVVWGAGGVPDATAQVQPITCRYADNQIRLCKKEQYSTWDCSCQTCFVGETGTKNCYEKVGPGNCEGVAVWRCEGNASCKCTMPDPTGPAIVEGCPCEGFTQPCDFPCGPAGVGS